MGILIKKVNKTIKGLKIADKLFIIFCNAINKEWSQDSLWWNYRRLRGCKKIQHGDELLFLHHHQKRIEKIFVKRCTGLPGDTIQINNYKNLH